MEYPLTSSSSAANLLPQLHSGLVIVLALLGPACGRLSIGDTGLAAGAFVKTTAQLSPLSSSLYVHTFDCVDCAFGPLSALPLSFDGTCQSIALAIGTVGAQGAVSLSFRNIAVGTAVESSAPFSSSQTFLTRVVLSSSPAVEVFSDKVADVRRRGLLLAAPSIVELAVSSSSPAAVSFSVLLPSSETFSGISIAPKFFPVDLVYQLLSCFSFGALLSSNVL
jgi:hypothetical protein